MILYFITQIALDIVYGGTWWAMKKTTDGVYYVLSNVISIRSPVNTLKDSTLREELVEMLLNKNAIQRTEIRLLADKIVVIEDFIARQKERTNDETIENGESE
tara:strand:- start:3209 stop:3517 length:309 start_codon:yes stop_codon:yes gene_type:complete